MESLARRFRARLSLALSLARTYDFITELEPPPETAPNPFHQLGEEFMAWRLALQDENPEAALDAVERTWVRIEANRRQVIERDAAIQAYRVRWACENAPLRARTVDSLGRFYRLAPYSTGSQSKYEYVMTRRLAGPMGPDRRLAPTDELISKVVGLEHSWQVFPVEVEDTEAATVRLALQSFASEATRQADAAAFTRSGLMRRFGAFKASIGDMLFDPRLTVAVVEANVAVLNVLNHLLAEVGGRPFGVGPERRRAPRVGPPPTPSQPEAPPTPQAPPPTEDSGNFHSQSIDLSGLGLRRPSPRETKPESEQSTGESALPVAPVANEAAGTSSSDADVGAPSEAPDPIDAPAAPHERGNIKTAEIDLSGLEIVVRPPNDARAERGILDAASDPDREAVDAEAARDSEADDAPAPPLEQQPSRRAFELGSLPENSAIIQQYLTPPRSPEVWQLDLDAFLGSGPGEVLSTEAHTRDRRRALELILAADDLICLRETRDGAPSAEHKAKVKAVAGAMVLLRASLHRSTNLAAADPGELEILLYVSDHLLWERLRLDASLKRKPRRRSSDRVALAAEASRRESMPLRFRRHHRVAMAVAATAAGLILLTLAIDKATPPPKVDPEVGVVSLDEFGGVRLFDEGRAFKATLFITAGPGWRFLGPEERRDLVRRMGAFAAERGYKAVSVVGAMGEPLATFKDDEAVLESDLLRPDIAKPDL